MGQYVWGMYSHSIDPSGVDDLPYATIVSDQCRTGFESCESIVGRLFDDLDSVMGNLRARALEYLENLWADVQE